MNKKLDVPSKRPDAFRQGGDFIERGERHPTSIDEVHAQPAHTAKM